MKTGRKNPQTVGENRGMTKQDTENISGCKSPLFDIIMKYILYCVIIHLSKSRESMTTRMNPNKTRELDSLIFPQPFIVLVDLQNSYFSECQILNQNVLAVYKNKQGWQDNNL